jgi:predicted aspartyl protease
MSKKKKFGQAKIPLKNVQYFSFTTTAPGLANRIITDVSIFPAFDPSTASPKDVVSNTIKGLWDTGATGSCITKKVVDALGLSSVGIVECSTASGRDNRNSYMVNLLLPNGIMVTGIRAIECALARDIDALIGMDVILKGDFAITNFNGKTMASYCYPSRGEIDFNKRFTTHTESSHDEPGRNDDCPCGSTHPNGRPKKYKECHGAKF